MRETRTEAAIIPSAEIREAVTVDFDPRQLVSIRHADLCTLVEAYEQADQRVTDSEAYRRGRADGYAEAYRLFGPELESLRERVSDSGKPQP